MIGSHSHQPPPPKTCNLRLLLSRSRGWLDPSQVHCYNTMRITEASASLNGSGTESPMTQQKQIVDNIDELLAVLPVHLQETLRKYPDLPELLEVVVDLGRPPEARFPGRSRLLSEKPVTKADIEHICARVGQFTGDNRAGIERTLHRISAIRNRLGMIVGLTCRVGRAVYGTIDIVQDIVETGKNILMVGRPGVGKTTKLREVARVLSDIFDKRVVVVDTSNEIGGDGDIPHPAIGRSRRMQVPRPEFQHAVMIEAVENHFPEVIIIDEIGTEQEALAARTIAERGVQLIGTAHGNSLENLIVNPTLSDLVGGIQAVILSDEEARRRGTQKTVRERKAPPTFDTVIEIIEMDRLVVHHDVATTIDRMLRGEQPRPETRLRKPDGKIEIIKPEPEAVEERPAPRASLSRPHKVFSYGISRSKLERAIRELRIPAQIIRDWSAADTIIALRGHIRRLHADFDEAMERGTRILTVKSNTYGQVYEVLRETFGVQQTSLEEFALQEAAEAIDHVLAGDEYVELLPQNAYIRRLQHELASQHNLVSSSVGQAPRRRVRISRA